MTERMYHEYNDRRTLSYVSRDTADYKHYAALTPVGFNLSRCLTAPKGPMQEAERLELVVGSYRMVTYRGWELEATTRLQSQSCCTGFRGGYYPLDRSVHTPL